MELTTTATDGETGLLTQHDAETGRLVRSLHLQASADGKSVLLIDFDERKVGIQREYRFEITIGGLIALIRAHGAETPAEQHAQPQH